MTKKTKEPRLPEKLSDLIEVALVDLRKVERMKRTYRVDMEVWHEPNSKCAVCHAGAVMACTLGAAPDVGVDPEDFSIWNAGRLSAINELREGYVWFAGNRINIRGEKRLAALEKLNRIMPSYHGNPTAYKRAMKKLAADLRAIGE